MLLLDIQEPIEEILDKMSNMNVFVESKYHPPHKFSD